MDDEEVVRDLAKRVIAAWAAGGTVSVAEFMLPPVREVVLQQAEEVGSPALGELVASLEVETVAVDGHRAEVTFRHPVYGRDPEDDSFIFCRVDGRWFLDFDVEA